MPVSVLPAPPTNAPPSVGTPANAITPFTRSAPPLSPALPSTGSSVPLSAPPIPAAAAGAGAGSAIGLGPAVLGAGLGVAAGLGAASQLSGVSPGDIAKQALRELPGFDPNKNYDPARFGLPYLPDLSGEPLPRRKPDGSPSKNNLPRGGIPQRNTPSQPIYPFNGGQDPGRNYFVPYSYTVPGTVQNGAGNPVLPGPIGGIITTTGGGLINYYIQYGGGQRFLLSSPVEQPASIQFGNVRPVDGNPDGPGSPPALFVPSPVPSPVGPPDPVPPATPQPGPPPEKKPLPPADVPPFSEPVPFRRPSQPPEPATPPVPTSPPTPPEREPDRAPPPVVPEPARPSPGPGPVTTPNVPGTVPPLEPLPKVSPPLPGEAPKPSTVPETLPAVPPLFDPLPRPTPVPQPDTQPVKPLTPNEPAAPSGVPPMPPAQPGTQYPGDGGFGPDGKKNPPAEVPPIIVTPNPPSFDVCCAAILDAIAKARKSLENKADDSKATLDELEKYCIPLTVSTAEVQLSACTNSGVVAIGNNTYAIRFESCATDVNISSQYGGTEAPAVDFLGWYAFSSTIYGGGDRMPIHYKEQVIYPPPWAKYISFTYKGACTGKVYQRYLLTSGIDAEFQAERLFRRKA